MFDELPLNEVLAKIFGYISIGCWIVVFSPQYVENYQRKNTDGVSVSFLWLWILGDILNLLGIILENLLFTMLLLALYYLLADCLLMAQVFYYRKSYHKDEVMGSLDQVGNDNSGSYDSLIPNAHNSSSSYLSENNHTSHSQNHSNKDETSMLANEHSPLLSTHQDVSSISKTRFYTRVFFVSSILLWIVLLGGSALFFFGPGKDKVDMSRWHLLPQLLGWGSAILYCFSRIPQIMQNFRNESVEGLSLIMFIFSVVGNVTYCISILLVSLDPTYLLINYPWLLGSGGTLFFDFTIFFQFYMYRKSSEIDSN